MLGSALSLSCMNGFSNHIVTNAEAPLEETELLGLITKLQISLSNGDGKVWATAKNIFTLFPATVSVYVELYYSDNFETDYYRMTLAARDYTYDLDQGNTLTVTASTGGKTRYWKGRIYFKIDDKDWDEKMTNTILVDGDGNYISG